MKALAALVVLLSACGSVELAGDAGADLQVDSTADAGAGELEQGITPPRGDAGVDVAGDRDAPAIAEVLPPRSSSSCAAAAAAAGYVDCRTCKGPAGEDLSHQCRAVVDCVASDPKYSPLVQTCNMTVGTGNGDDAAAACVLGLLRMCGSV